MSSGWWIPNSAGGYCTLIACILLLVPLAACTEKNITQAQAKAIQPDKIQAEPSGLHGGDRTSWITPAGDNADSNYCDAALKLPLATEPTWEFSYTDAVFSSEPPQDIVHYDGVLAISAYSTQVLGLDAHTGELLFNNDLYSDGDSFQGSRRISSLYLSPSGLLTVRNESGRIYCWDISKGDFDSQWVFKDNSGAGGIVADHETFFAGNGDGIVGLNAETGIQQFEYPSLLSNAAIIMSESGLIVSSGQNEHKLIAFDRDTRTTKWVSFLEHTIDSIVLSDTSDCVYVMSADEVLKCLNLQTGELLWEYSWTWLMDSETRLKTALELDIPQVRILPTSTIVVPDGICLPLTSGDVFMFTASGEMVWHYEADSSLVSAMGFTNAILIKQFWEPPEEFRRWRFDPFNQIRPDWKEVNAAFENREKNTTEEDSAVLPLGLFARIVALDISSGNELDAFEHEEFFYGGFTPAYTNIVVGKVQGQRQTGRRRGLPKCIVAYNWLEAGSE